MVSPIAVKHASAQAQRLEELRTITFAQACEQFLTTDKIQKLSNKVHRRQWRSTLALAFPTIGSLPLQTIDSAAVLRVLMPVWARTPETGSRLRGRIERVFDWAKPLGLFTGDNPASREILKDHLPAKAKAKHHSAMSYQAVPAFMADLRKRDSISAKGLEFVILTAARTSEVLGMTWGEVDLEARLWTVPGSRMKAGRDHRVPLSARAIELLRALPQHGEHVFGNGKPLSNMALLQLLRGAAGNGYTVHGFRSSFRDWCGDRTAILATWSSSRSRMSSRTKPRPPIAARTRSTSAAGSWPSGPDTSSSPSAPART
jgi:integrase